MEQKDWRFKKGNENTNVKVQDCLPTMQDICPNKCLPVTLQHMWKDNVDLPRCQNIMDHRCMFEQIWQV